ncbi:hypothetical protein GH714_005109 [Hevea brasiliensis]|uniref:T-complex protein 11 n=1 Tax=Hevea brasiliensis TaxID=3981 RepID=A0A6A6KXV4_HEVBR|nr:hypothetical protein GH714_005109 [Hevea brasiliensis]
MATGVESSSPETERVAVALDFPISDALSFSSPPRIPRRLRKRLLEARTPCTVEEIEAKLRHADLRRQQFYEKLSSKARPKPRSPSRSSSHDEDLGQRLEAKLQAAEQKRLDILAKAQMRLARLDELRQAAKSGAEMRFARERERLGMKVELRVQQAEANRMLILKANRQRRASQKERMSQSILRRMARESKYKERVRAAIHQKRTAAERKRMGLLEAEKKRACARVLQVRRVAKSVSHQREIERRRMRDHLENRLQRAKRQRAEYLRQRGRQQNSVRVNWNRMHKQADLLSRKLARCWRQFLRSRRTTLDLAKNYDALKIHESSVKPMPFEQLARLIESATTLQTVKALLDRLESRLRVSRAVGSNHSISLDNIDHLLKRVATPRKRVSTRNSVRSREAKKVGAVREAARSPAKSSRYPVRVVLCAYMILGHPDAVLSGQGDREISLAKSAEEFIRQFELLIRIILDGPIQSSDEESDSISPKRCTFRSQLATFDKAWCSYLNCFVVWKVKDAQSLEEDMVTEDQKLLREKIQHLSGDAGIERMEHALSETRSKYFEAKEMEVHSACTSDMVESIERPNHVVRSLFRDKDASQPKGFSSPAIISSHFDGQLGSSVDKFISENELIVNEFLHERHHSIVDVLNTDKENIIKAKIRETMEAAFWDGVMESIKQDEPCYDRVVELVREVRDGISEMAPESWKQQIDEAIDLDILSQWLSSVRNCKDQEWEEHTNFLSALINHGSSSQEFLPSTTLRTGASFMLKTKGSGTAATSSASNTTGIEQIVEIISGFSQGDRAADPEKLQSRKLVMARMLAKSLQAGDPIFEKVSHAVYLAIRGIVLGGSGPRGKLAEMALRQAGAVMLAERVVETAEILVVAATVSVTVHGPWEPHSSLFRVRLNIGAPPVILGVIL